jgi:hypothetical protein
MGGPGRIASVDSAARSAVVSREMNTTDCGGVAAKRNRLVIREWCEESTELGLGIDS